MCASPRDNRLLARAVVVSQFAPPFMFSGVAVALPELGKDLHVGATSLGLVETLFLAGSVAFLLPVGRLADAGDKNSLYKLGLLTFGLTSILIGVLSSVPLILALRFLQGVASAVFSATGPAILADIVPAERRGQAYGSSLGAIYAGLTLGPICAGLLVDLWGWRAVFLAGAAAMLAGFALVRLLLPSRWQRPTSRIHVPSALLIVSAVLSLVAGTALLARGPVAYALLAAGPVLASAFVLWQRKLEQPLLRVDALVRNRPLRNALLAQLLLYMNAYCTVFLLSIYMQVSLERSARTSGLIIAFGSVLMAVMAPVAGRLADRFRAAVISSAGVGCVLATTLLGLTLHEGTALWFVVLILGIQGLGFALFSSPNMTTIMNSVRAEKVSMASALGAKARSLGMISGMLVTGMLIARSIGNAPVAQHPGQFIGIVVSAFSILAFTSAAALGVSLASARPAGPRPPAGGESSSPD